MKSLFQNDTLFSGHVKIHPERVSSCLVRNINVHERNSVCKHNSEHNNNESPVVLLRRTWQR